MLYPIFTEQCCLSLLLVLPLSHVAVQAPVSLLDVTVDCSVHAVVRQRRHASAPAACMRRGWGMQPCWSMRVLRQGHRCGPGEGWCPYADIMLAINRARASCGDVRRVMVIDTDVHQGNGHERDKLRLSDSDIFIVDLYNAGTPAHALMQGCNACGGFWTAICTAAA